ncbi:unnamed protein product, partial [Closterium sp. NIES-53]
VVRKQAVESVPSSADSGGMALTVDMGDGEYTVDGHYVSNKPFLEVEVVEWCKKIWQKGGATLLAPILCGKDIEAKISPCPFALSLSPLLVLAILPSAPAAPSWVAPLPGTDSQLPVRLPSPCASRSAHSIPPPSSTPATPSRVAPAPVSHSRLPVRLPNPLPFCSPSLTPCLFLAIRPSAPAAPSSCMAPAPGTDSRLPI